jgi:hypothetical protein
MCLLYFSQELRDQARIERRRSPVRFSGVNAGAGMAAVAELILTKLDETPPAPASPS